MKFINCSFSFLGNISESYDGGALNLENSNITVQFSTFSSNKAHKGGAIS